MRKNLALLVVLVLALASARTVRAEGKERVREGGAAQQPVLVGRWLGRGPYPGYVWLAFPLPRPACRRGLAVYAVEVASVNTRAAALAFPAHNTLVPCGQGRVEVAVLARPEDAPFVVWVERAFNGQAGQTWRLETPDARARRGRRVGKFWRNCASWR